MLLLPTAHHQDVATLSRVPYKQSGANRDVSAIGSCCHIAVYSSTQLAAALLLLGQDPSVPTSCHQSRMLSLLLLLLLMLLRSEALLHLLPPSCQGCALPAAATAGWWQGPVEPDALLIRARSIPPVCGCQELLKCEQVREGSPACCQVSVKTLLTQKGGDAPQVPVDRQQRQQRAAASQHVVGPHTRMNSCSIGSRAHSAHRQAVNRHTSMNVSPLRRGTARVGAKPSCAAVQTAAGTAVTLGHGW
jgi:hypothetical protein